MYPYVSEMSRPAAFGKALVQAFRESNDGARGRFMGWWGESRYDTLRYTIIAGWKIHHLDSN